MASFYFDVDKLKREWTEDNLTLWAEYTAESFRSDALYKDGWTRVDELTFNEDYCEMKISWGLDEEGYSQVWNDTLEYQKEDWFKEYDEHFPERKPKPPVGIKFHYMDDEPEEEYSVFGTKI